MNKKTRKKHRQQRFEVLPGEGRRFSFSRLKQAAVFYILLLIALVVIAQLGYHWLGGQFLAWRLQVVAAEPGVMELDVKAKGVITRKEEVIVSPADGLVLQMTAAGDRVAAGTILVKIGAISRADLLSIREQGEQGPIDDLWRQLISYWQQVFTAENEDNEKLNQESDQDDPGQAVYDFGEVAFGEILFVYNENPGLLSYYIDGGEDLDGPFYLSSEEGENLWEGSAVEEGDLVEAGQPILKIVDNWQWFFSVVLPLDPGRALTRLPSVEIEFDFAPNEPVQAKLDHFEIDEFVNSVRLTFVIEKQVTGFERERLSEASLLYERQQGIIVPAEALFEKNSSIGVYLNQGGRVVFNPVTVIKSREEKVMVEGLAPCSLVISRPELVEEGQRLY